MQKRTKSLTYLIGSWVTVITAFMAGEVVFKFGALGGILLALSFIIAFIFVIPFLNEHIPVNRLPKIKAIIHSITLMEMLIINLLIGTVILQLFQIPALFAIFISLQFVSGFIFLFRTWKQIKYIFLMLNVSLLFALAIFLPNYIYLQGGLETVYHNLQHYHPWILHLTMKDKLIYFSLITIIFYAKLLSQIPMLQTYIGEDIRKGVRKLFVGVLIIMTLILAFSTVTVVAVTKDLNVVHANQLFLLLIQKQADSFIFMTIITVLYLLTIIAIVNAWIEFKEQQEREQFSLKIASFSCIVIVGVFLSFILLKGIVTVTVVNLFLSFGFVFSVITIAFLLPQYRRK